MASHLKDVEFVRLRYHAQNLADAAHVAYWSDCSQGKEFLETHRAQIRESLAEICDLMGLRVVEAGDVTA